MFSDEKTKAVAGIFANMGHIFFGSVALPFWLDSAKNVPNLFMVLAGLFIAVCFWTTSINLIK